MKKANILICDDEPGVRNSLQLILGDEYTLICATNGEEAVQYVKTHNPDLAILDVKMPKMDGLDALQQIKRLKPNLPVFMATGYEASDVAAQAVQLGADDYLVKPFDREKVQSKVHAALHPRI